MAGSRWPLAYVLLLRAQLARAAYRWLWRNRAFIRNRRRLIRERRSCSEAEISSWFFARALRL